MIPDWCIVPCSLRHPSCNVFKLKINAATKQINIQVNQIPFSLSRCPVAGFVLPIHNIVCSYMTVIYLTPHLSRISSISHLSPPPLPSLLHVPVHIYYRYSSQDCMNDGLGLLSRFSSLLTVGFISFYIAAIFVENWSSAEDQVNTVLDAGSTTTGVDLATFTTLNTTDYTYSLDTYCVDTPIPSWNLAVRTKSKGVV